MTWYGRPPSDEDDEERVMAWKAAVPADHSAVRQRVILEAYDDELTKEELEEKPPTDEVVRRTRRRATVRRVANLIVFALAVVGAAAGVAVAWMHVVNDPLADAHAYYEAASRLNAGQPLYPAGVDPNSNHIYLYPPLLAIALRPVALLPFAWFALAWELVVIGAFIALVRHLGVRRRATWLAIGILGVPIGWALTVAQAHIPMTYLLALGQPWSIAIAANLKLTPVLIAIWWLGRRDFEAFFAFLVWGVLLLLAQVLIDSRSTFAYFQNIGFEEIGQVRNISLYAQSPVLWIVVLLVGALITLALARTRWGWAAVVTLVTFSPPRLLVYMLTGLLAALRQPRRAGEPDPDDLTDPASVDVRSVQ